VQTDQVLTREAGTSPLGQRTVGSSPDPVRSVSAGTSPIPQRRSAAGSSAQHAAEASDEPEWLVQAARLVNVLPYPLQQRMSTREYGTNTKLHPMQAIKPANFLGRETTEVFYRWA
jgi:hypothetical protein